MLLTPQLPVNVGLVPLPGNLPPSKKTAVADFCPFRV